MKQILLGVIIGVLCTAVVLSNRTVDAGGARGGESPPRASFACMGDLNGDFVVDVSDLLILLSAWGPCQGCQSNAECDDGLPCTVDYCDNGTCVHDPIPGCCNTGGDCGPNQECQGLTCVCASGFMDCDGDPNNGCEVSILNNPSHCGGCNITCGPGESCVNGSCVSGCQDIFYADLDEDGWGDCDDAIVACGPTGIHTATICGDCDDFNPSTYPGAPEFCDGIDNDCNGVIDDNVVDCPPGTICVDAACVTP